MSARSPLAAPSRRSAPLLVPLLLAGAALPAAAGQVIVVDAAGGGTFTSVAAAVAAASDGDTLLLAPGTYVESQPIEIGDRSLALVGDPGGFFSPPIEIHGTVVVAGLSAGRDVRLENLTLLGRSSTETALPAPALLVLDAQGSVLVEDCFLVGGFGVTNAFPDGAAGLRALRAEALSLVATTVEGGEGQFSWTVSQVCGDGGPGLRLVDSQVAAVRSNLDGGAGGGNDIGAYPYGGDGGLGCDVVSGALTLVTAKVRGGAGGWAHEGGDGGDGLALAPGSSTSALADSFVAGGQGGFSDAGPDGASGAALVGALSTYVDLGGVARSFDVTSPVRSGQQAGLSFQSDPGDAIVLFLSDGLGLLPLPDLQGAFLLDPLASLAIAVPGPGSQLLSISAPPLAPGTDVRSFLLQPAFVSFATASIALGPAEALTVLDPAF